MLYALFVAAMVAQVITGRTHLLAMRGAIPDRSGLVASLIGIGAGLSFFAIIVWGFATFPWYLALGTIVAIGLIAGLIVTPRSFAAWYTLKAPVDFVALSLTVFLWWHDWPL